MNLRKHLVIAAAATALLTGTALPASAAPVTVTGPGASDTTTTFTLNGGSLTLSVQASATLTNAVTKVAASTITGSLGATNVNDTRGAAAGWVVSGASTTFTGTDLSVSNAVKYSPLVIVEEGTSTVTPASADTLIGSTAIALLNATEVSGSNTAAWTPGLKVEMPAGALAGAYTGTVTTSIA